MDVRTEERYEDDFNQGNLFIMKRSGERVPFDASKIVKAIEKANAEVTVPIEKMEKSKIEQIAEQIKRDAENAGRDLSVEEIQDKVENAIMISGYCSLARLYITYRYKHNLDRKVSTLDKKIESLIDVKVQTDGSVRGSNEEVNQENSNKDPKVLSVQRDYMAGEWSRDYTNKYLLSEDVVNAHRNGLIHVHDKDYMAQREHNCSLINLKDMLQHGTCISGIWIDPPKSFMTAATVSSQIIAQVASQQYGGQTISLAHLAPLWIYQERNLEEDSQSHTIKKELHILKNSLRQRLKICCDTKLKAAARQSSISLSLFRQQMDRRLLLPCLCI